MSQARTVMDAKTSEADFQAIVIAMARALGYACYHTFDSRRSEEGFPDLILIRGSRLLALELKTMKGALSLDQVSWLTAFSGVERVEIGVYRPADMDLIEALLRRGT